MKKVKRRETQAERLERQNKYDEKAKIGATSITDILGSFFWLSATFMLFAESTTGTYITTPFYLFTGLITCSLALISLAQIYVRNKLRLEKIKKEKK
jgi:hypothetical protein